MAKFYGAIGFGDQVETRPGIHEEQIVERMYYGDVNRAARSLQTADQINDNINISHEISIVADPYANNHFHQMRYVVLHGAKWKVTNVEVKFPRLILTVGGLSNVQ